MYEFLLHAHSGWRYLVCLVAAIALLKMLIGYAAKRSWGAWDKRLLLFYTIALDVQFLLGIALYIVIGRQGGGIHPPALVGEHAATMVVAIILAHVGKVAATKAKSNKSHFARGLLFTFASLVMIGFGIWRITHG